MQALEWVILLKLINCEFNKLTNFEISNENPQKIKPIDDDFGRNHIQFKTTMSKHYFKQFKNK